MLEIWGMRVTGGTLKSVGQREAAGGESGVDEAQLIARYVEETEHFDTSRPVLIHRFGFGRSEAEFRYRQPGEPLSQALIRLGWFCFLGVPQREIPGLVLARFVDRLASRLQEDPYVVPVPTAEVPVEPSDPPGPEPQKSLRTRYYGR